MKLTTVRKLIYTLLALMCILLIVVWYTDWFRLSLVAIALLILIGIINHVFWKCPHCGANLGRMEKQNHCHSCGKELEM